MHQARDQAPVVDPLRVRPRGRRAGRDGGSRPWNNEIANPHPAGTIESLRSLDYSTEAAVADLLHNSIGADATHVDVVFSWDGRDSWVAVTDDGGGMTEPGLVTAMTIVARGLGKIITDLAVALALGGDCLADGETPGAAGTVRAGRL